MPHLFAANRWWDGGTVSLATNGNGVANGGAGTWNLTTNNWDQGNGLPHTNWVNAANDHAIFGGGGAAAGTVTVSAALVVNQMKFLTNGFTIGAAASGPITFGGTYDSNTPAIDATGFTPSASNPSQTISAKLTGTLAGGLVIKDVNNCANPQAGRVYLTSAGNTNDFVGDITVLSGYLHALSSLGNPNNKIKLSGGGLLWGSAAASYQPIARAMDISGNSWFGFNTSGGTSNVVDLASGGQAMTGSGSLTRVNTTNAYTASTELWFSGDLTGFSGIITNMAGVMTIRTVGASAGGWVLNGGTLKFDAANDAHIANGAGKSDLVINGGTLNLNGKSETVNGLSGAGGNVENDAASTASTLTLGDADASAVFGGTLKNNGGAGGTLLVTKIGSGAQTFNGVCSHTGPTSVGGGALIINSNYASALTVSNGAALGGRGILASNVTLLAGGTLSLGSALGTLTISNRLDCAGNLFFKVDKQSAQTNDYVMVAGALTNSGAGTVTLTNLNPAAPFAAGDKFFVFSRALSNGAAMSLVLLPPLGPNLAWTNKLAVNGSIEIVSTGSAFYLAPGGSDTNPGSSNAPFASLARVRDAVRLLTPAMTGDIVVHIAPGEYYVTNTVVFTNQDSGRNGFSVVYQVDGVPGSARFIGGEKVTGWQPYSNGISVAPVAGPAFHTLYENGHRARKARTPNLVFTNAYPMAQASYLRAAGVNGSRTNLIYNSGELDPANWNLSGAQVMIWSGGKWNWFTDTVPVSSLDTNSRTITLAQLARYPIYQSSYGGGSRYFVQGVLDLLDEPGEFHYDPAASRLYYYPVDGDASAQEIIVPRVQRILSFQGASESNRVSHVRFVGLRLEATDFTAWFRHAWPNNGDSGEGHLYPQYDRQMNMPQHRTGMVYFENTDSMVFDRCILRNSGYSAFYWYGCNQSNTVQRCWLSHLGHSGVYLEGRYPAEGDVLRQNHIVDNLIHDVGELVGSGSGVDLMNCSSNEVAYCDIYNSPRYAVVWDAYVGITNADKYARGNWMHHLRIHDCSQDSGDTAPVYSWGSSTAAPYNQNTVEQTLIDDTWAHPSMTDYIPNGVFMDGETLGQIFVNVEVRNSQGAAFRSNGANVPVLTNVSWQAGFSTNTIAYPSIGVLADFPFPVMPERFLGHAAGGITYLSWLPVANAAKYHVYTATNRDGPFALLGTIAAPGFVNPAGVSGQARYYAVSSLTAVGDESPLSKTVAVTPTTFPISDDFENGLGLWTAGKGVLHLSPNQSHSLSNSFVADQDAVVAYLNLGAPFQGAVQLWMYDPGGSNACTAMARADNSAWDSSLGWDGLGISTTTSTSNYCYRIEGTVFASAVPRSAGWHQLAWDYTSGSNVVLSIDGTAVVTTNNAAAFQTVAFGDWWSDGVVANVFFDDVLVSPQWSNDTDHNGIDDTWEMLYFGHLLGVAGAAADADGDGQSNLAEYLAGTDPADAGSALRILQVTNPPASGWFQIAFASVPGRTYDLQKTATLAPPAWSDVQTNIIAATTQTTLTQPLGSSPQSCFFRIRLHHP